MSQNLSKTAKKQPVPVLLLGHPRSGTNLLTHVVRSDERTSCLIEPFSLHSRFMIENDSRYWDQRDYDERFHHKGMQNFPETQKFLSDFKNWVYAETGELRVFKETTLFLQLKWLSKYLPNLKIVYIERGLLGVADSFKRHNFFEKWGYDEKYLNLVEELNKPEMSRYSEVKPSENSSWIDRLAFIWYVKVMETRRNLYLFPNSIVEYKNFSEKPFEFFEQIFAFMGLDLRPSAIADIRHRIEETRGGPYSTFRDSESLRQNKIALTQIEIDAISRISNLIPLVRDSS